MPWPRSWSRGTPSTASSSAAAGTTPVTGWTISRPSSGWRPSATTWGRRCAPGCTGSSPACPRRARRRPDRAARGHHRGLGAPGRVVRGPGVPPRPVPAGGARHGGATVVTMTGQVDGGDGAGFRGYRDTAQVDIPMAPPRPSVPIPAGAVAPPPVPNLDVPYAEAGMLEDVPGPPPVAYALPPAPVVSRTDVSPKLRTVGRHLDEILAAVPQTAPIELAVLDAQGLLCAEEVVSQRALPAFDQAALDGYAGGRGGGRDPAGAARVRPGRARGLRGARGRRPGRVGGGAGRAGRDRGEPCRRHRPVVDRSGPRAEGGDRRDDARRRRRR